MKLHDRSPSPQNSAKRRRASTPGSEWLASLVRVCRGALEETEPVKRVEGILSGALRAIGAETAFLVGSDERRAPVVQATVTDAGSPEARVPSNTILRSALACKSPRAWLDVRATRIFTECASVRQAGIRSVLAAPVGWDRDSPAALVLDTRMEKMPRSDWTPDLLGLFATLLGLAVHRFPVTSIQKDTREPAAPQPPLVGRSKPFQAMIAKIRKYARCRLPVLIHGETGSGKEGAARMIHDLGPRRHGPFLAVNCASIPEPLLEAELFGARRGAYTGADSDRTGIFRQAEGGTLLLDEIGDMPMAMQSKLLRVLQEEKVRPLGDERETRIDVRVLSATHRNLFRRVEEGLFREDLYYRLAVLKMDVPPLRDRLEDLPLLIRRISPRLQEAASVPPVNLSDSGLLALRNHSWPGNIRELESVLARSMVKAQGRKITPGLLEFDPVLSSRGRHGPRLPDDWPCPLEVSFIRAVVADAGGNLLQAAARIGWSRQKLYRRMKSLEMEEAESPPQP